jgi:hypothetical protein
MHFFKAIACTGLKHVIFSHTLKIFPPLLP